MRNMKLIGRDHELKILDRIIDPQKNWGKLKVVCIDGVAGVGKTRLLEELQDIYSSNKSLFVWRIFDFDDADLHFGNRIEAELASVAPDIFNEFLEINRTLTQTRQWDAEAYEALRQKSIDAFIRCFNCFTQEIRAIISFDTTEELGGLELWKARINYVSLLKNVVILIAGHNATDIAALLRQKIPHAVTNMHLRPLSIESSIKFLDEKEQYRHIIIRPALRRKLALLTGGYPILLNLAIQSYTHNHISKWIKKNGARVIDALPYKENDVLRSELENLLIGSVAQFRSSKDSLMVLLSHIYPVEVDGIPSLMGISRKETEDLIDELDDLMLIKRLPKSRIKLNDQVQDLVERVVLKLERDRGKSEYPSICRNYLIYLYTKIQYTRQEIKELLKYMTKPNREEKTMLTLRSDLEVKQRYLLGYLEDQAIIHETHLDPNLAFRRLKRVLKEVDKYYNPSFRKKLIKPLEKGPPNFPLKYRIQLDLERCDTEIQINNLEHALEIAENELIPNVRNMPREYARALYLKGNALLRLGRIEAGKQAFEDAVRVSEEVGFAEMSVRSQEALGWASTLMSNWDEARRHYLEAFKVNLNLQNSQKAGSLLTNLAFSQSFIGIESAISLITQAKQILKADNKRGLGRAYYTEGCIMYHAGQYNKATDLFRLALDIFGLAGDLEWKSLVLSWRGANNWALALQERQSGNEDNAKECLRDAEDDLKNSISIGLPRDEPMVKHRLARVYLEQGKIDEAEKLFEECNLISRNTSIALYELASLRDLVYIAFLKQEFTRYREFEDRFNAFRDRRGEWKNHTGGGMRIFLGLLGLGSQKAIPITSIAYFQEGLEFVSSGHTYSPNNFSYYLDLLNDSIKTERMQKSAHELGTRLLKAWETRPELVTLHPDAVVCFVQWSNLGKKLHNSSSRQRRQKHKLNPR